MIRNGIDRVTRDKSLRWELSEQAGPVLHICRACGAKVLSEVLQGWKRGLTQFL